MEDGSMKTAIVFFRKENKPLAEKLACQPCLGRTSLYFFSDHDPGLTGQLWKEVSLFLFIGSLGIVTRMIGPHLEDKRTDPGVLCVDQAGTWCIPVTGGHARHVNRLARELTVVEGMQPVITTAGDNQGTIGPEELALRLGCRLEGNRNSLKMIACMLLEGKRVPLWYREPLVPPEFPGYERKLLGETLPGGPPLLVLSDRIEPIPDAVFLRPPSLVVGTGFRSSTSMRELENAIQHFLAQCGYSKASLAEIATLDRKVQSLSPLEARWGTKLTGFTSEEIRSVNGTTHSPCAQKHLDIPGVCEPVLTLRKADCLVGKTVYQGITLSLGRLAWKKKGKLSLVSLGPGPIDLLTPRALAALEESDFILGYRTYLDSLPERFRYRIVSTGNFMGQEKMRMKKALELVQEGNAVAVVSSGDVGVFGMAAPGVEMALRAGIPLQIIPGVTASLWAASLLGSPLVNGFTAISLSDYLVPWENILRDLTHAVKTGLPLALYNIVERNRQTKINTLQSIVMKYRGPQTLVGVVRKDSSREITSIRELDIATLTMQTILIIGSAKTAEHSGYLVTERGYTL